MTEPTFPTRHFMESVAARAMEWEVVTHPSNWSQSPGILTRRIRNRRRSSTRSTIFTGSMVIVPGTQQPSSCLEGTKDSANYSAAVWLGLARPANDIGGESSVILGQH